MHLKERFGQAKCASLAKASNKSSFSIYCIDKMANVSSTPCEPHVRARASVKQLLLHMMQHNFSSGTFCGTNCCKELI